LTDFYCHISDLLHNVSYGGANGAQQKMGHSYRVRIGVREIQALEPNTILWDLEVKGFVARRQFSEVVTYSVIFRTRDGRQSWFKLGRHPILTPHLARQEAIKVLRAAALGGDPSAERYEERHGLTVAELCEQYQQRDNGKKPETIRADTSRIKVHIKPKLGRYKVASITSDQIEAFMLSLSSGSQSRTVGLLGAIFSWAVKKKLRKDNPCVGVEKPSPVVRNRRLSSAEYAQLGAALKGDLVSDIFLLLAVTGFRSSEARLLKWSEVDLERATAILEDSKTGRSIRPLSGAAIEIIKRQKQDGVYVFGQDKPISSLRTYWLKFGMDKAIVPHVLRHSFASLGADLGLSDNTIASLLGHSRGSITSRYMHGSDKALIAAANSVAQETLKLMRT
jgi:integrase